MIVDTVYLEEDEIVIKECVFEDIVFNNKIYKILLREAEEALDKNNGDFGDKNKYCLRCFSTEYNGSEGIIHEDSCIIKKIRRVLR